MYIYYNILKIAYIVFACIIGILIVWNVVKSKKMSDKIIGAIALVMFALRIFLIK